MINRYFIKLQRKLRRWEPEIPNGKFVSPYVYGLLLICVSIGVIGTLKTLLKKDEGPKNPPGQMLAAPTRGNYGSILERNIFNIDGTIPDEDSATGSKKMCSDQLAKSNLAYKVTGIIFGGTAQTSIVLLEQKNDQKNTLYKLGDKLPSGGQITDITRDKVFITSTGCPEYLAIEYPSIPASRSIHKGSKQVQTVSYSEPGFERTGNSVQVTRPWVENILRNQLSSTLQDARALPNLVNGKIKGFSLNSIAPESVYSKLGLQEGDVVSSINGIELNDAARAIQTLNSLRNEKHIELQVIRNGQPMTFNVNVQ